MSFCFGTVGVCPWHPRAIVIGIRTARRVLPMGSAFGVAFNTLSQPIPRKTRVSTGQMLELSLLLPMPISSIAGLVMAHPLETACLFFKDEASPSASGPAASARRLMRCSVRHGAVAIFVLIFSWRILGDGDSFQSAMSNDSCLSCVAAKASQHFF